MGQKLIHQTYNCGNPNSNAELINIGWPSIKFKLCLLLFMWAFKSWKLCMDNNTYYGDLNEKCLPFEYMSFMYLNTRPLVGDVIWRGYGPFRRYRPTGRYMSLVGGTSTFIVLPYPFLFPSLLYVNENLPIFCSWHHVMPSPTDRFFAPGTISQNKLF